MGMYSYGYDPVHAKEYEFNYSSQDQETCHYYGKEFAKAIMDGNAIIEETSIRFFEEEGDMCVDLRIRMLGKLEISDNENPPPKKLLPLFEQRPAKDRVNRKIIIDEKE